MQQPTFLMCVPTFFDVLYTINPWMEDGLGRVNKTLAMHQWQTLYQTLESCGAHVECVTPHEQFPDLVFTANAALILPGRQTMVAHFRHAQRQGESPLFEESLESLGFHCIPYPSDLLLEGAGDALMDSSGTLWVGHGPRSDERAGQWIEKNQYSQLQRVKLATEDFYHLDTCFCPLESGHALAYLPAFDVPSQSLLEDYFGERLIKLTDSQAQSFNANAVQFGNNILMNEPGESLKATLERLGYVVWNCPTGEFIKSGGSVKCLTLRID